jgi:hypothetical protein
VSRLSRRAATLLVLLLLAATPGPGLARSGPALLEVRASGRGVVWRAPIADGERFELAFTHSVEHSRWIHHYAAAPGAIAQLGSTFTAFGAGMPPAAADGTPLVPTPDGYFAAAPMRIPVLRMLNSRAAEITLGHRGRLVALGRLFDDFEAFEIRVR